MGSIPDPGGSAAPSFDEFQRQASLMTSCTLLWKELSDHFTSLEQDIQKKSEALRSKIQTLEAQTKTSLVNLKKREVTIEGSVEIALERLEEHKAATLRALSGEDHPDGEVDDGGEGLLRSYCVRMEAREFWRFVTARKKEIESLRKEIPAALAECVDPARFVLEAISEVFPVDKRKAADNDLGWACVLVLESLIPVVVDPVIGKSRLMVTPTIKEKAETIAEAWKKSLQERGGIENVKTPDVHTFLQHLVTFGIVKKADFVLYRKLVVGSAWRKQMPRLAVSLGLGDEMPDIIKELISRGQMLDAVHFSYEAGLQDRFPPAPLLKAFLRDAKKAAAAILEDPDNTSRAALAVRRDQTALRAVIKCIEEYKLEAQFPPENLKKRVEQLEKPKPEKRKPAAVPANKRTRACNNGPMPPAKAGRLTNAYVSSFPAPPPFIRSPSHAQYPAAVPAYPSPPAIYGSRSSPSSYAYSPEAASPPMPTYPAASFSSPTYPASSFSSPTYPAASFTYPAYGGYGNGFAPAYQQAYYR